MPIFESDGGRREQQAGCVPGKITKVRKSRKTGQTEAGLMLSADESIGICSIVLSETPERRAAGTD